MIRKALVSLGLLACTAAAHATAVWDITLSNTYGSDPAFLLAGTFTTADADINRGQGEPVLSFVGTLTDAYDVSAPVSLIPPGRTVSAGPGLVFTYDDLFYGPTDRANGWTTEDAFNTKGLLLQAGSSTLNVYASSLLVGLIYSPAGGYDEVVSGSITFDHFTQAVPEAPSYAMLGAGLLLLAHRRRMAIRRNRH